MFRLDREGEDTNPLADLAATQSLVAIFSDCGDLIPDQCMKELTNAIRKAPV
jgi:hypothetical protein